MGLFDKIFGRTPKALLDAAVAYLNARPGTAEAQSAEGVLDYEALKAAAIQQIDSGKDPITWARDVIALMSSRDHPDELPLDPESLAKYTAAKAKALKNAKEIIDKENPAARRQRAHQDPYAPKVTYRNITVTLEQDGGDVVVTRVKDNEESLYDIDKHNAFSDLYFRLLKRMDLGLPEGEPERGKRQNDIREERTGSFRIVGTNLELVRSAIAVLNANQIDPPEQSTSAVETPDRKLIEVPLPEPEHARRVTSSKPAVTLEKIDFEILRRCLTNKKVLGEIRGAIINRMRAAKPGEDLEAALRTIPGLDERTRRGAHAALRNAAGLEWER